MAELINLQSNGPCKIRNSRFIGEFKSSAIL